MERKTYTIRINRHAFFYLLCIFAASLFLYKSLHAATPNPGHPWTDLGNGLLQFSNAQTALRTFALPDANANILTDASAVTVAQGGTGWHALQANTVLLGNGTGAVATTTAGTNGQVLALVGGVPSWVATTTLTTISGVLGISQGGTGNTLTASNGGIVYSNASTLAILNGTATAGQILQSGSNAAPTWSTATYPSTAGTNGYELVSNGTNFVSTPPNDDVYYPNVGLYSAGVTAVTALTSGTTYFEYMGAADKSYTSCTIITNVTTAAATITWAEVGLFKGTPVVSGNASLTRISATSVSTTYNSVGRKSTVLSAITVNQGDPLWIAFGSAATTPFQIRGLVADDLQSGVFQTGTVQPSVAATPFASTLGGAAAVPGWVGMKCS